MNANEFVGLLFLGRDVAHSVHLNTRSYSKHGALKGFYDDIVDLADTFAETYQGRHELMGQIKLQSVKQKGDVVAFLEGQLKEIEECRYEVCEKDDSPLQNIIDEVVGLYLQTIYKLKFLA